MVCYSLLQWTTFCQLSYWLWQKTKTKVHRATVWTSLNSAGTTQIWKKLCQQPGHMVSWVNIWLAGIETVEYPLNIYRRENSLPSKFYVIFLNPFLLFSLTLKKKKKAVFPGESLWAQEPLFFPIITHYKFGMCVGSTIPVSNFHRPTMTRQLSRAPAEGNTQSKYEWEDPGGIATSRVFFPSLMVHWVAVQEGSHLLEGEG